MCTSYSLLSVRSPGVQNTLDMGISVRNITITHPSPSLRPFKICHWSQHVRLVCNKPALVLHHQHSSKCATYFRRQCQWISHLLANSGGIQICGLYAWMISNSSINFYQVKDPDSKVVVAPFATDLHNLKGRRELWVPIFSNADDFPKTNFFYAW